MGFIRTYTAETSGFLRFDGVNDYVTSGDVASFDGDYTYEIWCALQDLTKYHDVFSNALIDSTNFINVVSLFREASDNLTCYNGAGGGGNGSPLISETFAFTAGQKYHFALCRESNTVRMFIDGTEIGSGTHTGNTIATAPTLLGRRYLELDIWEYRISSTARYTSNFTPTASWANDTDTLLLYNFAGGSGNTVTDLSNNNNNGTLHNFADPATSNSGWQT